VSGQTSRGKASQATHQCFEDAKAPGPCPPGEQSAAAGREPWQSGAQHRGFRAWQLGKGRRASMGRGCFSEALHALVCRRGLLLMMDGVASILCF